MNKLSDKINLNYNNLKKVISSKLDINKEYTYIFSNDNNNYIVEIYLDDNLIIKAEYDIVGLYNIPLSVWYWSWNISFINEKLIGNLSKVKEFSGNIKDNYKNFDIKEADELYYLLSNGNFYVSSDKIDLIIKLVLYITGGIWIFPIKYSNKTNKINKNNIIDQMDRIQYILITKIIQYG